MTQYLAIYEQDPESWGAYSPDLPGCVAAEGLSVPQPSSFAGYVAA